MPSDSFIPEVLRAKLRIDRLARLSVGRDVADIITGLAQEIVKLVFPPEDRLRITIKLCAARLCGDSLEARLIAPPKDNDRVRNDQSVLKSIHRVEQFRQQRRILCVSGRHR